MFSNKTAWFSDSCECEVDAANLWVQYGGKLEVSDIAQFIFSDDWDHNDTKGFLKSQAYLKQHLAILKSSYVFDAVKEGIHKIILGNYLLVPPWVQKRISLASNLDSAGESPTKAVSKRRSLPEVQDTADRTQQAELLPHTSSQVDGQIGCVPQAYLNSPTKCSVKESASVTDKIHHRSPVRCVRSPSNMQGQALTSSKATGSVLHQDAPLRHGSNKERHNSAQLAAHGSKRQKKRDHYNGESYGDIMHVQDLPKVTDRLFTLPAKGDGVVIRPKISTL